MSTNQFSFDKKVVKRLMLLLLQFEAFMRWSLHENTPKLWESGPGVGEGGVGGAEPGFYIEGATNKFLVANSQKNSQSLVEYKSNICSKYILSPLLLFPRMFFLLAP